MVVSPSWALGMLQQTTVMLNQLFPDPETSTYDEQVRRDREATDREWVLDVENMLRSVPAVDQAEADEID